ncbi:hypothetical protein HELRODRAFT_179521 [Helobdella robusta]|uniref:Uncharacterized protein n=1 Tax=Helobdella robusta TaxID=6412 RepID=T1FEU2_HELRO|nr:hypothetical protein HELRODRAFT_179521 [Helobdella robusta]ESN95195.1 hypothetical protein HELRODRAFT_179521 [Helobdella robusta]
MQREEVSETEGEKQRRTTKKKRTRNKGSEKVSSKKKRFYRSRSLCVNCKQISDYVLGKVYHEEFYTPSATTNCTCYEWKQFCNCINSILSEIFKKSFANKAHICEKK